jgi:hypothetical protein
MSRHKFKDACVSLVLIASAIFALVLLASPVDQPGLTHEWRAYRRSFFGGWRDADRDCQNTRQEMLLRAMIQDPKSLSAHEARLSDDGCRVLTGLWRDPYTGRTFEDAALLDVDHLVPLKHAWAHGADTWTADKRRAFANDTLNLVVVSASENRRKGASGPVDYMPPNLTYRCEYIDRWLTIKKVYGLSLSGEEAYLVTRILLVCE